MLIVSQKSQMSASFAEALSPSPRPWSAVHTLRKNIMSHRQSCECHRSLSPNRLLRSMSTHLISEHRTDISRNLITRDSSTWVFTQPGHVKHVALLATGQAQDTYVKSYIRPDPQNLTKRKTQVVKASQNPTFSRELRRCLFLFSVVLVVEVVDMQLYSGLWVASMCCRHVLEESVWNSGGLMDNNKLYLLYIPLQKLKNRPEDRKGNRVLEGWFAFDKNV
ncbi:unnamed protein product [Heligmosomoides polygyrus]|uniref:C2 domain-containing protein n=1 Tax=Heligmosomoides polygyrus TaxID=6339 RepID=A0A3P8F8C4_HELPZ|nr:unnamed protein product [Heligmosomoides polygyrus]